MLEVLDDQVPLLDHFHILDDPALLLVVVGIWLAPVDDRLDACVPQVGMYQWEQPVDLTL